MSSNGKTGESSGKKEKKENPVLSFLNKALFKPIDMAFVGLLKAVEQAGLSKQIQYPHYLNQDTLWWTVFRQFWDFEIFGSEHVPPEGEPAVVCSNHSSFWDPLIQGVSLCHYTRRRIHEMGKVELFEMPLVNAYLRWIYGFPVKRGEHDQEAHDHALELLQKGEILGMFPEGTLNTGGTNFLVPKTGAIRLAIEGNAPIVPLAIVGTDVILGKGKKNINFNAKLTCAIGEPIPIHEKYKGVLPSHDVMQQEANNVMEKLKVLVKEHSARK
ncbi:MAG: lysophospholipid acyltransferase family protein [Candidatus Hodarchaeota archaeon]